MGVVNESLQCTKQALELWGEYIRSEVPVKRYGCTLAVRKLGRDWGGDAEQTALLVDHLVARLGVEDAEARKATELHYARNMNFRMIASEMDVSAAKAKYLVDSAIYWINGAMHAPSTRSLELMAKLGLIVSS